jgi:hypothetical protein
MDSYHQTNTLPSGKRGNTPHPPRKEGEGILQILAKVFCSVLITATQTFFVVVK